MFSAHEKSYGINIDNAEQSLVCTYGTKMPYVFSAKSCYSHIAAGIVL